MATRSAAIGVLAALLVIGAGTVVGQDSAWSPVVDGDPLLDAFPAAVGGLELDPVVLDGEQIVASIGDDEIFSRLDTLARSHGGSALDLRIATAGVISGPRFVALLGATLPGVPPAEVGQVLVSMFIDPAFEIESAEEIVDGRIVTRLRTVAAPEVDEVVILEGPDVIWFIVADDLDLREIVAALP